MQRVLIPSPQTTQSFVFGEIYPTLATDVGKEMEEWLL
jgi:hypothetical protein